MVEYDKIRDYIFSKYNKRVSNKWIAEVKRKVGMLQFDVDGEERELTCPESAEKAIIEAFEHFNMLDDRNDLTKINDEFSKGYTVIEENK